MALSNSYNYSVDAAGVIRAALEHLGVVVASESVDSDDEALALRRLNTLVKQWSHPSDGAPGLKTWLRRTAYLFLAEGTREYSLGPSQDRATETLNRTTISANEAAGQTAISVSSESGMSASDIIGIELDDGTLQWTTIASLAPLTIAAALTGTAAAGNAVFSYTPVTGAGNSLPYRPLEIIAASLRAWSSAGVTNDLPVGVFYREERGAFEAIPDKGTVADPASLLVEMMRTHMKVTLDYSAKNVDKVLRLVLAITADDLDATTDDLNFPIEWSAALEWELAKRCATDFSANWTETHEADWTQATGIARSANPRGLIGGFVAEMDEDPGTL